MKIVVLDGYTLNPGDLSWDGVGALGELTVYDRTPDDLILERGAAAEILLVNKARLSAEMLEELHGLRFVQVLATGYDVVDVAAAARLGVPVANVPAYSTVSVAQHTLALLLELTSRVGEHHAAVARGEWANAPDFCFWKGEITELAGKTLGIIGFGRIGSRVAEVCGALGMEVLAYNPHNRDVPCAVPVEWVELEELAGRSDVVSLHCPATPQNRGFVNRQFLESMKPGAILLNTARGALINDADLAEALVSGRLAGAAVDVLSTEPPAPDNPLLSAPNCIITPHIAWASRAARIRLMDTVISNLRSFLDGKPVNVVNAGKA